MCVTEVDVPYTFSCHTSFASNYKKINKARACSSNKEFVNCTFLIQID